ncbi:MAG: OsmC family protein [Pseudomonadales bacterium]
MLWFLAIAAGRKYIVESYVDEAKGVMAKNADGKLAMILVTLRPKATLSANTVPTSDKLAKMPHLAHGAYFIANSAKTEVVVEPHA